MSSTLLDGPISPELVLVAPPEDAEEAREALPDIYELYDWLRDLRANVEAATPACEEPDDERGVALFTLVVALNALAPLALIFWHSRH